MGFSPASVTAGDGDHTFTIAVTNDGTYSTAHAVNVTDTVDARLVVTDVSDDQGDTSCAASSGQSVDCTFATLAAGATAIVTVTYHVAAATPADPAVPNTGDASSPDNSATDSDTVALTITSDVALSVVKAFSPASVTAGDGDHTFTIAVTNDGTYSTAHAVNVTDTVDARLVVTDVSDDQGDPSCAASSGQGVDCPFAPLAAGAPASVTVTYHVAAATPADPAVPNTGDASSPDNSATDSDTVALTITSDVALSVV